MTRVLAAVLSLPLCLVVSLAALGSGPEGPPYSPYASTSALSEIPPSLLAVYRQAATRCAGLPWQVLAAIGFIESRHGGDRLDPATGDVQPPILGPPLDGTDGRAEIRDATEPDGWAHAHGPMQFLRTTWARWGVLAPGRPEGAAASPDNAWDAIHGAARYLCQDEAEIADLAAAVWRYNHSQDYVEAVFAKAAAYGLFGPEPAAGELTAAIEGATVPGSAQAVLAAGMRVLGVPYVWGGSRPETGFDCSGLVQWTYAQAGIGMPRTTSQQVRVGVAVPMAELAPGDLVFSRGGRSGAVRDFGHVGIYAGDDTILVAPRSGEDVSLRPLDRDSVQGVRRILTPPA